MNSFCRVMMTMMTMMMMHHVPHDHPTSSSSRRMRRRKRQWLPQLSSLSNLVLMRCARILSSSVDDMQRKFEKSALSLSARDSYKDYASGLLEYCCFETLALALKKTGYLKDKHFRRLSFDMMLAWEMPDSAAVSHKNQETSKENKWKGGNGLSYSALMPLLVTLKSTVGKPAFVRIASAMPGVVDMINVHSQFDALARSTGGRLTFDVYNNYLIELDKVLDSLKLQQALHRYPCLKGEIILEMDGFNRTEPVILHLGPSSFCGRLILTDYSLYYESATYSQKFDLANAVQEEMKPCGSGPFGFPLFNRAIAYSSESTSPQIIIEFPEFLGCSRRDYWLTIIEEIKRTHKFIRENCLEGPGQIEAISRSILGIMRFKATREVLCANPLQLKSLFCFYTPHEAPCGYVLLNFLGSKLRRGELQPMTDGDRERGFPCIKSAVSVLCDIERPNSTNGNNLDDLYLRVGQFSPDELKYIDNISSGLCKAITQMDGSEIVIPGEKADRLSINLAIVNAFLHTFQPAMMWINGLLSWDDPLRTILIILLGSFVILRDLLRYVFVLFFLGAALFLVFFKRAGEGSLCDEVWIFSPGMDNVGEVIELKRALDTLEHLLRTINTRLLRIRGLFYSLCPQATDQVILFLMILAGVVAFLPGKSILLFFFWEIFTRELPLRKEITKVYVRRFKRWWVHIPVAPINYMKSVGPKDINNKNGNLAKRVDRWVRHNGKELETNL